MVTVAPPNPPSTPGEWFVFLVIFFGAAVAVGQLIVWFTDRNSRHDKP